jgi:hypothetical protein
VIINFTIGTEPPDSFHNGWPIDDGAIAVDAVSEISHYARGLPFTANGRLAATALEAIDHIQAGGIGITAAGRVIISVDPDATRYFNGLGYNLDYPPPFDWVQLQIQQGLVPPPSPVDEPPVAPTELDWTGSVSDIGVNDDIHSQGSSVLEGGIAISGDGTTLYVGNRQQRYIEAPAAAAGVVYYFYKEDGEWLVGGLFYPAYGPDQSNSNTEFGAVIKTSYDGRVFAVGSDTGNSAAVVTVYRRSQGVWTAYVIGPEAGDPTSYGRYISLSSDGDTLAISVGTGNVAVQIWKWNGSDDYALYDTVAAADTDASYGGFCFSLDIAPGAPEKLIIGGYDASTRAILTYFEDNGSSYQFVDTYLPLGATTSYILTGVAFNWDGSKVVACVDEEPSGGRVIYGTFDTDWTFGVLSVSGSVRCDRVSINHEGNYFAVSDYRYSSTRGRASVYEWSGAVPTLVHSAIGTASGSDFTGANIEGMVLSADGGTLFAVEDATEVDELRFRVVTPET